MADGPVVLITGASMGLGEAVAREFCRQGYRVALAARSGERLERLRAELEAGGGQALAVAADVTRDDDVRALVEATLGRFDRLDVLVCNAGLGMRGDVHRLSLEDLAYVFDVNVFGVLRPVQAAVPAMAERGGGLIITVSSVAGRISLPGAGGYAATKHALNALADAMRVELRPLGIRVMNVHPGYTATEFGRNARGSPAGTGSAGQPRPPTFLAPHTAEAVARRIVRAAARPPRDLWTHPRERVVAAFVNLVPTFRDALLLRVSTRRAREAGR